MKVNQDGLFLGVSALVVGLLVAIGAQIPGLWDETTVAIWVALTVRAYLYLLVPAKRKNIGDFLRTPSYHPLYLRVVSPIANLRRDWKLYDLSLRIALLYPFAALALIWTWNGKEGLIGSVRLLPPNDAWAFRILAFVAFCTTAVALGFLRRSTLRKGGPIDFLAGGITFLVFCIAGWLAISGMGAMAATFTAIGAVALAFGGTATVVAGVAGGLLGAAFRAFIDLGISDTSLWVARAGVVALVGMGLVRITIRSGVKRGYGNIAYFLSTIYIVSVMALVLYLAPWPQISEGARPLLLFFLMLPLINAIYDYLSYVVTISLIRRGLTLGAWAWALGALDLLVAVALFTLLGITLIFVISAANALAGEDLFPLTPLFAALHDNPSGHLWLYLTLFSTLLPTLVHYLIAAWSAALLPFSKPFRSALLRWVEADDVVSAVVAPLALGTITTLSLLPPMVLFWLIYYLPSRLSVDFWANLGQWYLSVFECVGQMTGGLPAILPYLSTSA